MNIPIYSKKRKIQSNTDTDFYEQCKAFNGQTFFIKSTYNNHIFKSNDNNKTKLDNSGMYYSDNNDNNINDNSINGNSNNDQFDLIIKKLNQISNNLKNMNNQTQLKIENLNKRIDNLQTEIHYLSMKNYSHNDMENEGMDTGEETESPYYDSYFS